MRRRFANETGHWANLGLSSCAAANKKLPKGHFLDWLDRQDINNAPSFRKRNRALGEPWALILRCSQQKTAQRAFS